MGTHNIVKQTSSKSVEPSKVGPLIELLSNPEISCTAEIWENIPENTWVLKLKMVFESKEKVLKVWELLQSEMTYRPEEEATPIKDKVPLLKEKDRFCGKKSNTKFEIGWIGQKGENRILMKNLTNGEEFWLSRQELELLLENQTWVPIPYPQFSTDKKLKVEVKQEKEGELND